MFANISVNIGKKKGNKQKREWESLLIWDLGASSVIWGGRRRHSMGFLTVEGIKTYPCPSQFLIIGQECIDSL